MLVASHLKLRAKDWPTLDKIVKRR